MLDARAWCFLNGLPKNKKLYLADTVNDHWVTVKPMKDSISVTVVDKFVKDFEKTWKDLDFVFSKDLNKFDDIMKETKENKDMCENKCTCNCKPFDYEPKKIIYSDKATIVFWKDNTKTIVKCMDGKTYSPYFGFLACLAKKIFGTNCAVNRIVDKWAGAENNV